MSSCSHGKGGARADQLIDSVHPPSTCNRCVAAPLNPAYNASEVKFYVEDASSKLLLVHKGAVRESSEAVKAARELGVPIAEVWYDSKQQRVRVALVGEAQGKGPAQSGRKVAGSGSPNEEDVALLLHTSGTTGKPKAVPLVSA